MNQIWKTSPRLEGYYIVSNDGFVKRVKNGPGARTDRALSYRYSTYGYRQVKITINKITKLQYVHSLVAECFIGPRPTGLVINHKDGNHLNNVPENLEYVTQKENVAHARARGRCNQNFVINADIARQIKIAMNNGMREKDVVTTFGVNRGIVNSIRMKRTWAHI